MVVLLFAMIMVAANYVMYNIMKLLMELFIGTRISVLGLDHTVIGGMVVIIVEAFQDITNTIIVVGMVVVVEDIEETFMEGIIDEFSRINSVKFGKAL
jgi:hypothetical protein